MMMATKEWNALVVQNFLLQKNYFVLLGKAFLVNIGNFLLFVKNLIYRMVIFHIFKMIVSPIYLETQMIRW